MKRRVLLTILATALGITVWLSGSAVPARSSCDSLNRSSCSPPGATITCTWLSGLPGQCKCMLNRWLCFN